mgnify:CR=1 FL=1
MNGYLQCLIDQYEKLTKKALIPSERTIYIKVLTDLVGLQNFCKSEGETVIEDTPKKHMVAEFVGTMPDLMEYLKNLNSKGGK